MSDPKQCCPSCGSGNRSKHLCDCGKIAKPHHWQHLLGRKCRHPWHSGREAQESEVRPNAESESGKPDGDSNQYNSAVAGDGPSRSNETAAAKADEPGGEHVHQFTCKICGLLPPETAPAMSAGELRTDDFLQEWKRNNTIHEGPLHDLNVRAVMWDFAKAYAARVSAADKAEIARLRERVRELEARLKEK